MISQDTGSKSAFHSVTAESSSRMESNGSPNDSSGASIKASTSSNISKMTNFSIAAIMHSKLMQQGSSEQQLQAVRAASALALQAAAMHNKQGAGGLSVQQRPGQGVPTREGPQENATFHPHGIPELKRQRISGSPPKNMSGMDIFETH